METSSPPNLETLGIPPDHNGLYYDHLNSLLYYVHQGALFSKFLEPKGGSSTKLNLNSLSVPKSQPTVEPQIPRFVQDPSTDLMVSPNGFYLINGS